MSNAIEVTTATWDAEVAASEVPVVVDFWAPWCGPCRMVGPEIDKLSERLGAAVKFVKVNIDDNGDLAMKYGVMSIPTMLLFKDGEVVERLVGAKPKGALLQDLSKHLS